MLQLSQNTRAKVINVTPMAMKMGQKDTLPALSFRLEFILANTALAQLAPGLREFLFTKASTAPEAVKARQQPIEGVEPISDLPSLSTAAQRLGTFEWNEEQTGCTLMIDRGLGEDAGSNIRQTGCTVKKLQITAQEGGSFKARCTVNTSSADELDDATHGKLCKLKKRDIFITLEGPKVDQISIPTSEGNTVTPIKALAASVKGDAEKPAGEAGEWPFPRGGNGGKEGKAGGKAAH